MAEVESSCTLLRRLWAGTWDAARFAVERPLHTPAFGQAACAAQLDLAAQAVVRLRGAVGMGADATAALPLEGRSCALLASAVDGAGGMPEPTEDPAGFMRALVHAALQTGDGGYGLGLDSTGVDALLNKNCADLMHAAESLRNPSAAAQDVEAALAELSSAVQTVLQAAGAPGSKRAVELSGQLLQLSREMRGLTRRAREAAASDVEADEEMLDAAEQLNSEDGTAQEGGAVADHGAMDGEDETPALQRTKSQVIKRIKVDEVAQTLQERRAPVEQLRKVLSQLDAAAPSAEAGSASNYERTAQELKQVQKLQQTFRDFGEDLMEGMLALDQLSGLAEQDRQVRKDTLQGIQGLLDEIDVAKPRVAKMQKRLAKELEHLQPAPSAAEEPSAGHGLTGGEAAPEQPLAGQAPAGGAGVAASQEPRRAPATAARPQWRPRVDWRRVRLPVKFSSMERSRAYVLSANVPGLDPDSIRLARKEGGVLSMQGLRPPSAAEQRALVQALEDYVRRLPRRQQQQLTQDDVDELAAQLGHGRYGLFVQDLELPRDVDWEAIEPSYEDGVLRVLLPRRTMARQPPGGGWLQGMPGSFYGSPQEVLW
mmetsp:Transcript_17348/g.54873  ORF Transcript_17348/g.54873 Transcript_17348/m.54873 type:complete len:598 (-) Transcript_17348:124-1917(-)